MVRRRRNQTRTQTTELEPVEGITERASEQRPIRKHSTAGNYRGYSGPRVNKNSWTQFDSDTDMVHETTLSGSGESKLEALPAIMCNMGKVDLGPMPKNDMHSLTTKQAREGDSGNNRIPEETKEKVNSSRGRRESRATRDYKTHYDSNYAA